MLGRSSVVGSNGRRRAKTANRNADAKSVLPLPDWRGDWIYELVFRNAYKSWSEIQQTRQLLAESAGCNFVLIEEYGESDDSFCAGSVLRAWTLDPDGLNAIPLDEHALYLKEVGRGIYPFELIQFHIHRNRQHVVLGSIQGSRSGTGSVYRVEGAPPDANLVMSSDFGAWRS
jgi:hypothetical protein